MIRTPIAILLLSGLLLSACSEDKSEAPPPPPRPVLSVVAKEVPVQSLSFAGTVSPRFEAELGFRTLGRLTSRTVSVGDLVEKGQIIATIDPTSLELAVRSAQSDLSNAQAQLRNAQSTQQRQLQLAETRSGTRAALEEAEQGLKTASASVARAQANLNKANEQLSYAQLAAEFDGVVTATSAELGQVVTVGQVVVTIAKPDERDAVIDVPQSIAEQLKLGTPFDVALQLDPQVRVAGTVREIAPQADTATRTRRTKIALDHPGDAFRLGAVIRASASIASKPNLMLPATAIRTRDSQTAVWIVDEAAAKVALRPVVLEGPPNAYGYVVVKEGVKPGERVVIAGVNSLEDGQSIRIDQERVQ